jgi:hypothetical protein
VPIKLAGLVLATLIASSQVAQAALIITVNYTGDPQYAAAFNTAKSTWEGLLVDYQNGIVVARTAGSSYSIGQQVSQVFIDANVTPIDGAGGILGSAGPDERVLDQSNFVLATDGIMNFDSADVAGLFSSGQWEPVILHEMAHVLGFGTLWQNNNVYVTGTGEFLGANATAAWQSEFGQTGTPDVELAGGSGTANAHWNENTSGAGATGIVDQFNRDMRDELMTGWLNPGTPFISNMTVASFVDIGFTGVTAVPEPSSWALACLGIGAVGYARRRRQRSSANDPSAT